MAVLAIYFRKNCSWK